MKTKIIFSALLAGSFLFSVPAFAQNDDRDQHNAPFAQSHNRHQPNDPRTVRLEIRHPQNMRPVYMDNRPHYMPMRQVMIQKKRWREHQNHAYEQQYYYNNVRHDNGYHGQRYVVNNWREHNLSAPPRGYHWVQSGPDFLLAAMTNHVIMRILHR